MKNSYNSAHDPLNNNNTLLSHDTTLKDAWSAVLAELEDAGEKPHPFRYLTLATIDAQSSPDQRMVVLRKFDGKGQFIVYTDARSKKVKQIKNDSSISLLFYDSDRKIQLTIKGKANVINDGNENQRVWEKSASEKPHSYTSLKAPGELIDDPEEAYHWDLENPEHFCIVKIKATEMIFLQLAGHQHLRSLRTLNNGNWETEWIAP